VPVRDAHPVPRQLHRADFPQPDAPWLVVLFSSLTCESCASMREKVFALASPEVAVCDLEYSAERSLHDRYEISGVPMVVVADADGVVVESFVGPVSSTDLWAAVARVRD
jgi:thioredoxin-like negative regulator of GroEL